MSILNQYDDATLNSIKVEFNQIEKEAYGAPREKLDAIISAPIKPGVSKGAMTYTTKIVTEVGMAKIVSSDATDLPGVSIGVKKHTVEIHNVGDHYKFTQEELDAYAYAGQNLESDDALAARRKVDEKVDEMIYVGDADWNVIGLLNNPNVNTAAAANNAAGTSKKWKDKTLDEITEDIQTMFDTVFAATKGPRGNSTVDCDVLKVPREAYVSLTNRTKGVDSDVTFYKALLDRFAPQGLTAIECCNSGNGIGTSGTDRALLYKRGRENVFSVLPVPFRVLPPQHKGLAIIFNCIARCAGCVWRRPTTGVYMDEI